MRARSCFKKNIILKLVAVVFVLWFVSQAIFLRVSDNTSSHDSDGNFSFPKVHGDFGDMGRPVIVPSHLEAEAQTKFRIHQFNLVASDLIGEHRNLPNFRDPRCPNIKVTDQLTALKTSVIIVFHNEAWSTLFRTINSVIHRTPPPLLEEIILVDDASSEDHLKADLDQYLIKHCKLCHLERMETRSGLVRARLRGAKRAKGKTLTFLDAHCEASVGWLEPLLEQIAQDHRRVVCPIIDVINEQTFEYITGSPTSWGIFDWTLSFHWGPIPQREHDRTQGDPTVPLRTPTMAGGLFTISRDYFYELGSYDEGMIVWGGENVEMSLRVWQCGGELLIIPCSRVGHVFRKISPYEWPGGVKHVLTVNSLRTVFVWLDEYKEFYLKSAPDFRETNYGDITSRQQLRKQLHCKSFRWYLQNVHPESIFPVDFIAVGEIRNQDTDFCLDTMGAELGGSVGLSVCHGQGGHQVFAFTGDGELQSAVGCVDASDGPNRDLKFRPCNRSPHGPQVFQYNDMKFTHKEFNMCLVNAVIDGIHRLKLAHCDASSNQKWILPFPAEPPIQLLAPE